MSCLGTNTLLELTPWHQARIDQIVSQIVHVFIVENPSGFTLDPFALHLVTFEECVYPEVYIVSQKERERAFRTQPHAESVRSFISDNYGALCIQGNYIGFWEYEGQYYLDVSNVILGRERAEAFGRASRQLAIFHPYSGESILINEENDGDETTVIMGVDRNYPCEAVQFAGADTL